MAFSRRWGHFFMWATLALMVAPIWLCQPQLHELDEAIPMVATRLFRPGWLDGGSVLWCTYGGTPDLCVVGSELSGVDRSGWYHGTGGRAIICTGADAVGSPFPHHYYH
jgi:hypothetical protein